MRRTLILAIGCLLLTTAFVFAAVHPADIEWISDLPGVTPIAATSVPHRANRTYHTTRAADTFNMLLSQLPRHGWRIDKATDVEDARASVRVISARRGDEMLNVSVSTAEVAGVMTLSMTDHTAPGDETVHSVSTGHTAILNGNNENLTIHLDDGPYLVNGNANHVVLRGACSELTINGNGNTVTVEGGLGHLIFNGNNNTVQWSAAANPSEPSVIDNSQGNVVQRI